MSPINIYFMGVCHTFTRLLPFDTTSSVLATVQQIDLFTFLLCCACLFKLVAGVRPHPQFINSPLLKLLLTLGQTCRIQRIVAEPKAKTEEHFQTHCYKS
jgi:hypothetical protein